jgi:hypothetical protein
MCPSSGRLMLCALASPGFAALRNEMAVSASFSLLPSLAGVLGFHEGSRGTAVFTCSKRRVAAGPPGWQTEVWATLPRLS